MSPLKRRAFAEFNRLVQLSQERNERRTRWSCDDCGRHGFLDSTVRGSQLHDHTRPDTGRVCVGASISDPKGLDSAWLASKALPIAFNLALVAASVWVVLGSH